MRAHATPYLHPTASVHVSHRQRPESAKEHNKRASTGTTHRGSTIAKATHKPSGITPTSTVTLHTSQMHMASTTLT